MFGNPWALLGLLAPAAMLWFTWTRRGGRLVLPFDHGIPRSGRVLRALLHGSESLPALLLAIAVLLLAGPQRLDVPKARRSLTNIEFCVDISGSMTASFGEGRRYDAAMEAINDFIDYREGDAFGLTFFGHNVLHWVPLTSDVSAFRCAPPFMDPARAPPWFGGTAIGKAVRACRQTLIRREEGDRMIILISDGYSFDLANGVDEEIARELRSDGVVLYGVHVADGEVPGPVVNIAALSGGEVFAAGDPHALETVFRKIDEMQETRIEKGAAEFIDDFEPYCVVGLVLLAVHLLLQLALRFTPW